jgi:hypothetical protein
MSESRHRFCSPFPVASIGSMICAASSRLAVVLAEGGLLFVALRFAK